MTQKKKTTKQKAAPKAGAKRGNVTVRLSKAFRGYASGTRDVSVKAGTLDDILNALGKAEPALKKAVLGGKYGKDFNLLVDALPAASLHIDVPGGTLVSLIEVLPGPRAARKRVYLTFSTERVPEALVWLAGQLYDVTTNLRTASISEQIGVIATEFEGEPKEIAGALEFLRRRGVAVEPIEMSIVEG